MGAFVDWWRRAFAKPPVWEPAERRVRWARDQVPLVVKVDATGLQWADAVRQAVERVNADLGRDLFRYVPPSTDPVRAQLVVGWGGYSPGDPAACPAGRALVIDPGPRQFVQVLLYGDALATTEGQVVGCGHELLHGVGLCHNARQRNVMHPNVLDLLQLVPSADWRPGGWAYDAPTFPPGLTDDQRSALRGEYFGA